MLVFKEEDDTREKEIFFQNILSALEQQFESGRPYLTGYDFTLADIAFFNELVNTIEILEQNIDNKKYPNVGKWVMRMEDIGPIRVYSEKFGEELSTLQAILK